MSQDTISAPDKSEDDTAPTSTPEVDAVQSTAEVSSKAPAFEPAAPAPVEVRQSGSSAGLWLALIALLAVIGLGGAGYLQLQQQENQRFALQQKVDSLGQTVNQLDVSSQSRGQWFADSEERSREARRDITELQRQQTGIAARQEQNEKALSQLASQVQGGKHAWQRAEVEHLLLVANTRLQLQRDLTGAETALKLADTRLASLSNPVYLEVRQKIARELSLIEAVPRLDVQALALQLDGLSAQIDALATRQPKAGNFNTELKVTGGSAESPWHERLWVSMQEVLDSLVSIRRDAERREPLLPPEQGFYLRQNLRLQIESARLAALKLDDANFSAALGQADAWLRRYFDTNQSAVSAALGTIGKLRGQTLNTPLPDISGSLNALRVTEPEA